MIRTAASAACGEVRAWPPKFHREAAGPEDLELAVTVDAGDRFSADAGSGSSLPVPLGFIRCRSQAMEEVYCQIQHVRLASFPVLFEGETGVGKEHLVRLLHDSSARSKGRLVAVNCAAIPADLLEAELFGIARGVATGVEERQGSFQMASGGTLFLDEIGEMPPALQPKLLRVLDSALVQPVGGLARALDVRVVAATNARLGERVSAGHFRADLYHRIAGWVVHVPALRQRREDIPLLLRHFLDLCCLEAAKWVRGLTLGALDRMMAYDWPGNVRELHHEVRRLVYTCPDRAGIDSTLLSATIRASRAQHAEPRRELDLRAHVAAVERDLIARALERCGGRQAAAARLLGVSRNGLGIKLRRLGIGCPAKRDAAAPEDDDAAARPRF